MVHGYLFFLVAISVILVVVIAWKGERPLAWRRGKS
jgi:hypothetical protein